ncbi:substrate-binding domain-containing protein [Comamonas composti]|uniref:substrate-binding domain-containing protein n=1 Tax=Comamonas composti TaxID=408558 RepID=UPI0004291B9D|nr:substrate-binding domain-containing protein [Comamonas composti]
MATIKDVAKLAGVGVGTASRAISGRGAIAPETLARVQAAASTLAFRPSATARALSLRSVGMLGVYVPVFTGTFYGPILAAIDAELRSVGRHMVATSGCGQGDARRQALDGVAFLIERECDGIVMLSNALDDEDFTVLQQCIGPLAIINRNVPGLAEMCFSVDHAQAGRLAAQALLAQGHRSLAVISGPCNAPDNRARIAGFEAELARHGLALRTEHRLEGDFSFASGSEAAARLLAGAGRDYTALFCANDEMAIGAISRFAAAGLRVPQEVSVMGFDDSPVAAYGTPPLTTVHVPMHAVAVHGCRHLLNNCYGLDLPVQREFPAQIIWRSSVAAGPHAPWAEDE